MPLIRPQDLRRKQTSYEEGMDESVSAGFIITSGGSAHTKGSYATLVSSAPFPSEGFFAWVGRPAAVAVWLIDFAIGGAGAERVVVPNVLFQSSVNDAQTRCVYVPIYVPAGARVSARVQSDGASQSMRAGATLMQRNYFSPPLRTATAYGVSTATSRGTNVDAGATLNTKGAYSQVTPFTTGPTRMLVVALGSNKRTVPSFQQWLIDIAVGPAGQERIIVPNLWGSVNSGMDEFTQGLIGPLPVSIPVGTRLAARAQCTTATESERQFDIALYGLD